jgi:hypothetical protein
LSSIHRERTRDIKKIKSSLRVRLLDGHINNQTSFILFLPKSRDGETEIIVSKIFKLFGILSPDTFYTNINFLNQNYKVIYQEKFNESSLLNRKKNRGPILSFNKRPLVDLNIPEGARRAFKFARVDDFGGITIDEKDLKNYFLHPLSKLNYASINSRSVIETFPYLFLRCEIFFEDKQGCIINSKFEVLMLALNASHGLALEDRRFYYNRFLDRLEPIYYNGNSKIFHETNLPKINYTNEHIRAAKMLIGDFQNIFNNDEEVMQLLHIKDIKKYNYLKKNLKKNLIYISNQKNINNPVINNFFSSLIKNYPEVKFNLLFGNSLDSFLICNIKLDQCIKSNINLKDIEKLITNQISNFKKNPSIFINIDKNLSLKKIGNNSIIKKDFFYNDKFSFFYNKGIEFEYEKDKIKILQTQPDGKVLFFNVNLNNKKIEFYSNINPNIREKNISSLDGCVNFFDSNIKNIKIKVELSKLSNCRDAIHFENSSGNIAIIDVKNAPKDALDADFSNLEINEIFVNKTGEGGECIGLKSGKYHISNAFLNNCFDTAVSIGELGELKIGNLKIINSSIAFVSKDSSILTVKKFFLKNNKTCLLAYRKHIYFSGSTAKIKNLKCRRIFIQKGSRLIR